MKSTVHIYRNQCFYCSGLKRGRYSAHLTSGFLSNDDTVSNNGDSENVYVCLCERDLVGLNLWGFLLFPLLLPSYTLDCVSSFLVIVYLLQRESRTTHNIYLLFL
jgi:hypothetical protein